VTFYDHPIDADGRRLRTGDRVSFGERRVLRFKRATVEDVDGSFVWLVLRGRKTHRLLFPAAWVNDPDVPLSDAVHG
jgi:hypothetical protein